MGNDQLHEAGLPWKDAPDAVGCNFAVGDLILNLPRLLTVDGRIHAPTLLAASGAVAGYAAQQTLLSEILNDPAARQQHEVKIVTTKTGGEYYFGGPINERLLNQGMTNAAERLWSLAAGAAVSCGLAMSALPPLDPMFAHVSRVLGSPEEGFPSLPEVRPRVATKELLSMAWPVARMCFNGELSGKVLNPRVIVTQRWRPAITAHAANRFIRDVKDVVPPAKALIALFESAIYASKLKLPLR